MSHTPGPWRFHRTAGVPRIHVNAPDTFSIARVSTSHFGVEAATANARLIAAAPDLLSSLRSLVDRLRRVERWPVASDHMAYLQDAEAAIAKAEGR